MKPDIPAGENEHINLKVTGSVCKIKFYSAVMPFLVWTIYRMDQWFTSRLSAIHS